MARFTQVQAQEVGEGEHRGAADRLRTEHKEVGSGSGAGSMEVGTGGGLAYTGSGESLQASCEWTVASLAGAKAYFNRLSSLEDPEVCKNHLKALRKRLQRKCEDFAGFWRMGIQKRGAWHFHLVLFVGPSIGSVSELRRFISSSWHEVTGKVSE